MTRHGCPPRFTDGIEQQLRAVDDPCCDAVADTVAGTRSVDTLHVETWFKAIHRAEDVAIRLTGTVRHAYFLTTTDDGDIAVVRRQGKRRTYDRDSQYVSSLFEQYDPHPVRSSEVAALE